VAFHEGLSVGVVDAAGTAKCSETPFLRTVCWALANCYFVRAAGPRHNPRGLVCTPGGAVTVGAVPVARSCSSI